jgi:hypothetical protein
MADGERDHLRPDSGVFYADGRRGLGQRTILVDNFLNGAQGRDAE